MEFKCYELSEVAEVIDSLHKTPQYSDKGYPMVRVSDMYNGYFNLPNNVKRVTKETYQEFSKKHIPTKSDILMSRVGTYGLVNYNISNQQFCLGQNTVVITNYDFNKIDSKFLYYYLLSNQTQDQIERLVTGSTQKTISLKSIRSIRIPVISLIEQKSIAKLLSSFDDKIENNNAIIANLEEQAQTIFKSWFVDFEPFQDEEFVDSELGKIPKEWKVTTLDEYVEVKYGKDHKKLADGPYPVYGSGGIMRYVENFLYDQESVLIPRKGSLNNVIYINERFWSVDTMFYTVMKKKNVAKYIYLFLIRVNLKSMNVGSAVPSMTVKVLNNMKILKPTDEILKMFEQIVNPMFKMINQLQSENSKLTEIRDTLLPKLMSGEIRVGDVETETVIESKI